MKALGVIAIAVALMTVDNLYITSAAVALTWLCLPALQEG